MSKISLKPASSGTATFEIQAPATNTNRVLELPDSGGEIAAVEAVSTSSSNTVTHKLKVTIGGVEYFLLAADSNA